MLIIETFLVNIGAAIASHMVKSWLGDKVLEAAAESGVDAFADLRRDAI